jgi:hypothetical protein
MKNFAAWLAVSAAFAPVLAQSSLPQVDLGYQIQQASSFNVCAYPKRFLPWQLTMNSKQGKYTTSATSAMGSLRSATCGLQHLSHRRVGIPT